MEVDSLDHIQNWILWIHDSRCFLTMDPKRVNTASSNSKQCLYKNYLHHLFDYTAHFLNPRRGLNNWFYLFYRSWKITIIQTEGFSVAFGSIRCRLRSAGGLVPFVPQAFKALLFQYISYCQTCLPLASSKASSVIELIVFIQ